MSLTIIILLIIFVPAIPFFCLLKKRKGKFWLDESSLHLQPLFWFLVFTPLIISCIAWVLVSLNYKLDISINGYTKLMDTAKFPFLILTLSPILGAFVTSTHRSLQTAKQIQETEKKNKVDIYFAKRKFVIEQLALFETKYKEKIFQPNIIFDNFFKMKEDYSFEVNDTYLKRFNELLVNCSEFVSLICNDNYNAESNNRILFLEQRERQAKLSFNELCIKKDLYFGSVLLKLKGNSKDKIKFLNEFSDEIYIADINEVINVYGIDEAINIFNIKKTKKIIKRTEAFKFVYISEQYRILAEYMDFIGNIKVIISILSMIMPEIKSKFSNFEIPDADEKLDNLSQNMRDIFGDKVAAENNNPQ